jgi:hypothetical protein
MSRTCSMCFCGNVPKMSKTYDFQGLCSPVSPSFHEAEELRQWLKGKANHKSFCWTCTLSEKRTGNSVMCFWTIRRQHWQATVVVCNSSVTILSPSLSSRLSCFPSPVMSVASASEAHAEFRKDHPTTSLHHNSTNCDSDDKNKQHQVFQTFVWGWKYDMP